MTLATLEQRVFPTGILTLEEVQGLTSLKVKGRSAGATLPFPEQGRQRLVHRYQVGLGILYIDFLVVFSIDR